MNKLVLVAILSIVATFLLIASLKPRENKSEELSNKIKRLIKTPEFKILSKQKEFKNLLRTQEFFNLGVEFGKDFILTQLGL